MTALTYRVRRATIDDLAQLLEWWQSSQLPALELERRFTDFQVIEASDGTLAGAIGLQISGSHGYLHSEVFSDFSLADRLRPLVWERIQMLVRNHSLHRLWTHETAPFWKRDIGFVVPSAGIAGAFPAVFGTAPGCLLTLQLREEHPLHQSAEATFVQFQEAERARTEKALEQARTLNWVARGVAVLIVVLVCAAVLYLLFRRGN